MKLFCAGVGVEHPDITNASRRIKASEFEKCAKNGITITEVKVGFDGIVLANAKSASRFAELTKKQIFLALAKEVPVDGKLVDEPLPEVERHRSRRCRNAKIEVLGPPPTSGTRDAFVELAMEGGAKTFDAQGLRKKDKKPFKAVAHAIREDGAFIEAGENDNLIVQKLEANPNAPSASSASASSTRTPTRSRAPRSTASSRPSRTSPPATTGLALAVLLRQAGARRRRSRASPSTWPSSPARRPGATTATWSTRV